VLRGERKRDGVVTGVDIDSGENLAARGEAQPPAPRVCNGGRVGRHSAHRRLLALHSAVECLSMVKSTQRRPVDGQILLESLFE
jgi:hypothetical protein